MSEMQEKIWRDPRARFVSTAKGEMTVNGSRNDSGQLHFVNRFIFQC